MCMPVLIHVIDDRRLSASAPTLLVPTLKAPYPDQSVFRALTGSSVTVHVISGSTGNAMLVHRPALRRCGFYRSARWAALFEHAGAQAVLLLLTLYSSGWLAGLFNHPAMQMHTLTSRSACTNMLVSTLARPYCQCRLLTGSTCAEGGL